MQTLDPGDPVNKTRIKASITAAIAKQVAGSNREEIAQRVEETYGESLLGSFCACPGTHSGISWKRFNREYASSIFGSGPICGRPRLALTSQDRQTMPRLCVKASCLSTFRFWRLHTRASKFHPASRFRWARPTQMPVKLGSDGRSHQGHDRLRAVGMQTQCDTQQPQENNHAS